MSADGTWTVTLDSPMGAQTMELALASDGGTLTGTMSGGPMGSIAISDGTVDGDALAWKASIEQPMALTLEFAATLDGDSMAGEAQLGTFGSAKFSGTRS